MIKKWQCVVPAHAGLSSGQLLRNWKFMNSRPALTESTFAFKADLCLNTCVSYFLMLHICISNTSKGVKP